MANQFLRDTATEPGTDGSTALGGIFDLADTQGTETTLGSGNTQSATFVLGKRFQKTVDDAINGTSFPISVDMASVSASTMEWQAKVQRVDSSNVVQAESDVLGPFNTAGIKTGTLTLSTTWGTGDRLAIAVELRKVSGGGNRSFTLNVNDADSFVDAPLASIVAADGSSAGTGAVAGVAASVFSGVTSAAGIAASVVLGIALWAGLAASAGIATVSGDGADAASGPVEADGSSAGIATVLGEGLSITLAAADSTGVAGDSVVGASVFTGQGSSSGVSDSLGIGAYPWLADAVSNGASTVTASGEDAAAESSQGRPCGAATIYFRARTMGIAVLPTSRFRR